MNLLILVVYEMDRMEDFYSALLKLDVIGLQAVDTSSVADILAQEAPIFAGLRQLITRPKAESKTVFGMTEDDNILRRLKETLKKIGLNMDKPGIAYAMLIPVSDQVGSAEM